MKVQRLLKSILSKTFQTIVKIFEWPQIFKYHHFKIILWLKNLTKGEKKPANKYYIGQELWEICLQQQSSGQLAFARICHAVSAWETLLFAFAQSPTVPNAVSTSAADR